MNSPVHGRLSPLRRLFHSHSITPIHNYDFLNSSRIFPKSPDLRSPSPQSRLDARFLNRNHSIFHKHLNNFQKGPKHNHRIYGGNSQTSLFTDSSISRGGINLSGMFKAFGAAAGISTFSSADTPQKRMQDRLEKYGFVEKQMKGDGNCMYRSIADQIFGDESQHARVRKEIVNWLSKNENHQLDNDGTQLGHFLETDKYSSWPNYCKVMSKDFVWGDQMTLLAASELYNTKIHILSNVKTPENSSPITNIEPRSGSKKTIYLSHWHENHYNSMYKNPERLEL